MSAVSSGITFPYYPICGWASTNVRLTGDCMVFWMTITDSLKGCPGMPRSHKTKMSTLHRSRHFFERLRRSCRKFVSAVILAALGMRQSFHLSSLMSRHSDRRHPGSESFPIRQTSHIPYFNNYAWFGSQGRVAICRALVSAGDAAHIRRAALVYLLIKGPNFFFAPQFDNNTFAVPPSRYNDFWRILGQPTGALQSQVVSGSSAAYRLYWRPFRMV